VLYVSVYKQLVNFQNFLRLLSRLYREKG